MYMRLLLSLGILTSAIGCGADLEPGDYRVYRLAIQEQELSDGCKSGINEVDDSSSMRTSATVVLFAGQAPAYFLDIGSATLEGGLEATGGDGDSYGFAGKTVDVEWTDPSGTGTWFEKTLLQEVDITVNDELVEGAFSNKISFECSGQCPSVPADCRATSKFVGTEIEDVELRHEVAQ